MANKPTKSDKDGTAPTYWALYVLTSSRQDWDPYVQQNSYIAGGNVPTRQDGLGQA